MQEIDFLQCNFCLPNFIDSLIARKKSFNPDALPVSGLICFCGVQGSGKTLSSVLYLKALMEAYPKSICVSNICLNSDFFDSSRIIPYQGISQIHSISNGEEGVIILLDEIQIEFNSLESKQMNIPVFELVCQQRKQRKHIIGTTQVFGRLAKPFREQFKYAVLCQNVLGSLFLQRVYTAKNVAEEEDIKTELTPKSTKFYFASPEFFKFYDTYQVVTRVGKEFK